MTGIDKARAIRDKIVDEVEVKKAEEEGKEIKPVREEEINNSLATLDSINANAELAKMYSDNAQVGSQNLSGGMPILKIHSTGRSVNELADGMEPNNGWFFYKPTKEQF